MLLRLAGAATALLVAVAAPPVTALVAPGPRPAEPPVPRDQQCVAELLHRADDPQLHVLGCDPRGRGRAVVAFGDVDTAEHLVVLVPGSDTDLRTLVAADGAPRRPHGLPMDWARTLFEHAAPVAGTADTVSTAVVLWVGYTTPVGLGPDAVTGAAARAAAPALVQQVHALQQDRAQREGARPRTTVVGHSYGAVVAALAAPALDVDDIVLVASPGARADDVADLRTTAAVWATRSRNDWIRRVPHVQLGDLGHGADPTDAAFGARELPAGDVPAHDGYFLPGTSTLDALEAVITGTAQVPAVGRTSPLS